MKQAEADRKQKGPRHEDSQYIRQTVMQRINDLHRQVWSSLIIEQLLGCTDRHPSGQSSRREHITAIVRDHANPKNEDNKLISFSKRAISRVYDRYSFSFLHSGRHSSRPYSNTKPRLQNVTTQCEKKTSLHLQRFCAWNARETFEACKSRASRAQDLQKILTRVSR